MNFLKKELGYLKNLSPIKSSPIFGGRKTFGQRAADKLTQVAGSWGFIITFIVFLILWMVFNTSYLIFGTAWDEKPFIMLNLILSCLAAFQAPIILMSQNRQAQRDRIKAEYDYRINKKAEKEIREIRDFLLKQNKRKKK
ncbi:MAG: DUF1003 domain-containing protein [Candidatus Pacearchaeota archaeon]|nr:DUF1003 domain-containing protein [Candidatus Pacearchaeota archaeon]